MHNDISTLTITGPLDLNRVFATSDHHFGSYRLSSFFQVCTKDQELELVAKWNSIVGKKDIVYYNGDFCDAPILDLCHYVEQLNGQIILVRGNHDKFDTAIYKEIFQSVVDEIAIPYLNIVMHHCPVESPKFKYEIFGHLHRRDEWKNVNRLPNKFCSCVQANNGYPVSLANIMQYFKQQTCQEDCLQERMSIGRLQ